MKKIALSVTLICMSSFLQAQDESSADKAKKLVPTNKEGIQETAEQLSKRVELDKAKRAKMAKQAELVRQRHAAYLAGIKSGKINPYQRFFDAYPAASVKIKKINQEYKSWLAETNANVKDVLQGQLLADLQEVGIWLQRGDYVKDYDGRFSAEELKEFERLERHPQRHPAKLSETKAKLEYTTSATTWYTLQHLPVPLVCKAPARARVFLHASDGGQFENGLSIIEKIADKEGNVSVIWLSAGDAAGLTQVKVVSPECSNIIYYNMNVMNPMINFPAYLNAKRMQQLEGQTTEFINKMLKKYSEIEFSRIKKLSNTKHSLKK